MFKIDANRRAEADVGGATDNVGSPLVLHGELLPPDRPKRTKTGGRQKGIPNKLTRTIREAIRDLAESNADRAQEWLDRVAETDPAQAVKLYLALLRFCLPTLQASAVADITPTKSNSDQLAKLTDRELLETIVQSPQASELLRQGMGAPTTVRRAPALPEPDLDDLTDAELLR
jgi:hypothetical protein